VIDLHIHTAINPSDVYPVPGCDECRLAEYAQAQHTPGPWHYATKGPGLLGIYAGERFAIASDLIAGIASADNQVANARLIAAAPDLLAALDFLTQAARTEPGMAIYAAHLAQAEDAIRKARGQ